MKIFIIFLVLAFSLCNVQTIFINVYPKFKQLKVSGDTGEALFLTPLIEAGQIQEAQTSAEVILTDVPDIKSYSGYLTVNKEYNSNLFFWYFPSQNNVDKDPVVLWLQGGPGATSLYGLFEENGPIIVNNDLKLTKRQYSWTQNHSVLFIDNPVGTGYSFTDNDEGYATDENDVAVNLYEGLLQFFQLFPKLQKNDFFVTGESYAGKYAPAISYAIYKNNPNAEQKINLKGIAMGNGFSDPENQLKYSEYLYQLGLIDTNQREEIHSYEEQCALAIQEEDWLTALDYNDDIIGSFLDFAGFSNYYNYLIPNDTFTANEDENMFAFVQRSDVRKAIHVGSNDFQPGDVVESYLMADTMKSVASWISELLENYRVLIYNGQLDVIVAYPLTINYLKNLQFSSAEEYKTARRHQWYVDGELAGFSKTAGNLTEVLVRNAGHMVPADQPKWATDLITKFTRNQQIV